MNFQAPALVWASAKGHLAIVESLLSKDARYNISQNKSRCDNFDARVEASDSHGSSALVWASRAGHIKVVKLLLNIWIHLDTWETLQVFGQKLAYLLYVDIC